MSNYYTKIINDIKLALGCFDCEDNELSSKIKEIVEEYNNLIEKQKGVDNGNKKD